MMLTCVHTWRKFARDERGATAIEYAIMGILVSVFIITAVAEIGTNLSSTFSQVGNGFN